VRKPSDTVQIRIHGSKPSRTQQLRGQPPHTHCERDQDQPSPPAIRWWKTTTASAYGRVRWLRGSRRVHRVPAVGPFRSPAAINAVPFPAHYLFNSQFRLPHLLPHPHYPAPVYTETKTPFPSAANHHYRPSPSCSFYSSSRDHYHSSQHGR
jgi:hypothetical protein